MVLRISFAALLCAGCLHRAPPQRLGADTPVATLLVVDRPEETAALPEEVSRRVVEALAARNLTAQPADPAALPRNTAQRLQQLARAAQAPYVLLLETRVAFFDAVQGRFRWIVSGRATLARKDDLAAAAATDFEIPVFLLYEREREDEALAAARGPLAERIGALVDGFLANLPHEAARAPGSLYFALVDRFAPPGRVADPQAFHGGTLRGVLAHVDDLHALGVEAVWLSPVFAMRTEPFAGFGAYHGYWVEDLNRLEPRFGTEADLRALADALHARGMKLVLDLVVNHVGPGTRLAQEKPGWFHHQGPIADWNDAQQLERHDVQGLPDLAQENPEVYDYLLRATLGWVERVHPDGFRLDAVKHVPLAFWARFNAALRARGLWLVGEALDGEPARLARLEPAFDSLFDFPLAFALTDVFCKDKPVARLGAVLSLDRLYRDARALTTLLDDHDLPRVAGLCRGDLQQVTEALDAQMALRGIPLISYGTEAGLAGLQEPENRADQEWSAQPLRGAIRRALRERAASEALRDGAQLILDLDGDVLTLGRATAQTLAVQVINRGAAPATTDYGVVPPRGSIHLERRGDFTALLAPPAQRTVALGATAPLRPGDALLAVGAGPELGGWDPARGLAVPGSLQLPARTVAEFKLVIRRRSGAIEWEQGDDRFVFVRDSSTPQRLELTFRS